MRITQLLEALDLRGTGAEAVAELELEGLQRDPDFKRCKEETLQVLEWTIHAFRRIEKDERETGLRPEGLASRRLELETMGQRLASMSPAKTAGD